MSNKNYYIDDNFNIRQFEQQKALENSETAMFILQSLLWGCRLMLDEFKIRGTNLLQFGK